MTKKLQIRSAYSGHRHTFNPVSGEPTRVKQEFKNEVDINEIIARMQRGIQPPPWMTSSTPYYGDFSDMPASFMEAHAIVEAGEAAFKSLPLEFRRELDHDPRNLDKAPRELYERFGLIKPKDSPSPAPDRAPGSPAKSDPHNSGDLGSKARQGSKKSVPDTDKDHDE